MPYALGEGVETDDALATRWSEAAAEQGYPAAQYNLTYMHRACKGVEQNDSEAFRWYRLAAVQGHPEARADLTSLVPDSKPR